MMPGYQPIPRPHRAALTPQVTNNFGENLRILILKTLREKCEKPFCYFLVFFRLTLVATTQSNQPGQLAVSARLRSIVKTFPTPSVDQQVSARCIVSPPNTYSYQQVSARWRSTFKVCSNQPSVDQQVSARWKSTVSPAQLNTQCGPAGQ
jgi:hypothetical protein